MTHRLNGSMNSSQGYPMNLYGDTQNLTVGRRVEGRCKSWFTKILQPWQFQNVVCLFCATPLTQKVLTLSAAPPGKIFLTTAPLFLLPIQYNYNIKY